MLPQSVVHLSMLSSTVGEGKNTIDFTVGSDGFVDEDEEKKADTQEVVASGAIYVSHVVLAGLTGVATMFL